jgi:hypothetical protein
MKIEDEGKKKKPPPGSKFGPKNSDNIALSSVMGVSREKQF